MVCNGEDVRLFPSFFWSDMRQGGDLPEAGGAGDA